MTIVKNFLIFITLFLLGCQSEKFSDKIVYLDPNATVEDRVNDLMGRMTLEEKVAQMCQYVGVEHIKKAEKHLSKEDLEKSDSHGFYPGLHSSEISKMVEEGMIGSFLHVLSREEANHLQQLAQKSRLKIPLLIGIDAIHGTGLMHGATIYPSPIGLASTWEPEIANQVATETAKEMRATGSHWAFSPNIDLARDPRWGRVGETFGEDPLLVSDMGVAMINGLQQGDFTGDEKVLACAKHLVGGGESINGLNAAPTEMSERTLRELHLPSFQAAVDAGCYTIMAAHNEINRIPCHANKWLMTDLMRDELGFDGFYVSDWRDIERLNYLHKIAKDQKEASFITVKAGMDMHMHGPGFMEPVLELIKEGKLTEERIDQSARRILEAKFRLGLFENNQVTEELYQKTLFSEAHQKTALEAAQKSIVLLKNNGILPLKKGKYKNIFVTGPLADNHKLLGDWVFAQPEDKVTTVLEGLKKVDPKANFSVFDYKWDFNKSYGDQVSKAVAQAKKAELAIVVVGENSVRWNKRAERSCGENFDRDNLQLPGSQQELIEALQKTGVPVVVVFINGRPLATTWIDENVPAILEAWEPGSFGGQAIADVLYGEVNPSGKMPISVTRNVGQIKTFYNHQPSHYKQNYAGSKTGALYSFGYGLSYSQFEFSEPILSDTLINADESLSVTINVKNTSDIDGEEVVQLYLRDQFSSVARPVKELKGYEKIALKAGESKKVSFAITPEMLSFLDVDMKRIVESGAFTVMVGNSSRDEDLKTVEFRVN